MSAILIASATAFYACSSVAGLVYSYARIREDQRATDRQKRDEEFGRKIDSTIRRNKVAAKKTATKQPAAKKAVAPKKPASQASLNALKNKFNKGGNP